MDRNQVLELLGKGATIWREIHYRKENPITKARIYGVGFSYPLDIDLVSELITSAIIQEARTKRFKRGPLNKGVKCIVREYVLKESQSNE